MLFYVSEKIKERSMNFILEHIWWINETYQNFGQIWAMRVNKFEKYKKFEADMVRLVVRYKIAIRCAVSLNFIAQNLSKWESHQQ